jgi:hypothetical protein
MKNTAPAPLSLKKTLVPVRKLSNSVSNSDYDEIIGSSGFNNMPKSLQQSTQPQILITTMK